MGSYFSLHDSAFWEQTVAEAPEPSIWSNVHFSPLALHQRVLLERPGRVYHSFSSGLRQGGASLKVSDESEVELLVGFEEAAGRLYSAVLLRAPESNPHRYGRAVEEVTLTHPAARAGATAEPNSPSSYGSPGATRRTAGRQNAPLEIEKLNFEDEESMQETHWPYLLIHAVKEGVILFFTTDIQDCVAVIHEVALRFGEKGPATEDDKKKQAAPTDPETASHIGNLRSLRESLKDAGKSRREINDHPEVAALQARVTERKQGAAAQAVPAAEANVKVVRRWVGKAPPAPTKLITEMIIADLARDFKVHCDAEEQPYYTNCVVFCVRIMMVLQIAIRGYDIRETCESPENKGSLGSKAGEAACEAWEKLWRTVRG